MLIKSFGPEYFGLLHHFYLFFSPNPEFLLFKVKMKSPRKKIKIIQSGLGKQF